VVGVSAVCGIAAIGRVGVGILDILFELLAACSTRAGTNCGTGSSADRTTYSGTDETTGHRAARAARGRAGFVVVAFSRVRSGSATGTTDARAYSGTHGTTYSGTDETTGYRAARATESLVRLVIAVDMLATVSRGVNHVRCLALDSIGCALTGSATNASADCSTGSHTYGTTNCAKSRTSGRARGSTAGSADGIACLAFVSCGGHACACCSTDGGTQANTERACHYSTDSSACGRAGDAARSFRCHTVAGLPIAVSLVLVELAGIVADVTSPVLIQDVERHPLLAIGNASRHEDAAALYAGFIQASFFFRNACINQCANQPTGCRANAGADQCGSQRAANCQRADARYGNCADANQEARQAAQNAAADCACYDAAAAGIGCNCL
jgi:hypothetical protein